MVETSGAFYYQLPWYRQIWQLLGFGECSNPNPWPDEMEGMAPAYLATNTLIHLDFWDRLRILLSGKAMVAASTKTDVIVKRAVSASNTSVLSPTYKIPKQ